MKKSIFTLFVLFFGAVSFAQVTYYWIGGKDVAAIGEGNNWNTVLNASGDFRSTPDASDILVFDGTNVGGGVPTTGEVTVTVTGTNIAQFKLKNNAMVVLQRTGGSTGTLTIEGDATTAPDLVVEAGSSLKVNSALADGNVNIALSPNATGLVSGTVTLANTGTHRITSQVEEGLVFAAGAVFNSDAVPTSGAYPFGSSTSQSVHEGVRFDAGSSLYFRGTRSPMGSTSTFQACKMMPGSNFYIRTTNAASTGSYTNLKTFGNIYVQNAANFTCDGPFYKIDTLVIDNGCSFKTHTSGNTPILGNLVVNGTLNAPVGSSNTIIMGGNTLQTISGAGSIDIPNLTVANYSNVVLSKSLSVATTCNIVGKLDFGASSKITGTGTFTSRVAGSASNYVGNTATGSFQINGIVGGISGVTGLAVTGTGLAPQTNVVGFSSSNGVINLSKPVVAGTSGATFTFSSDSATLVTANPNGFNEVNGSVALTDSKSYQSGTNYIINGATASPIGISTTASSSMTVGNVTLNAPVTTNYTTRVLGTLTLNTGKLTIRPSDTLRIVSGNNIGGAPFGADKYIVTSVTGGSVGVLRIDDISSARIFPVGSANNYLPATLTPESATDFAVSVFEGATQDGTPTGAAFSAPEKATVVDAVWTINRPSGTGNSAMKLMWPSVLEGSSFTGYSNAEVGIGRHNGATWDPAIGNGDNTANFANATFSSFSPFIVSKVETGLPVSINNISATIKTVGVEIGWKAFNEDAIERYTIERSSNGIDFSTVGNVNASKKVDYTFVDISPLSNMAFYRVKIIGANGYVKYSNIIVVKSINTGQVSLYPNPVVNLLSLAGLKGNAVLKIINAAGQAIIQQKTSASSITMDVSNLKPGYYLIEIQQDGNRVSTHPFIKK